MKRKNIITHVIQIILIILFVVGITPKQFQNDTFFTIPIGNRVLEYGVENEEHLVWHEGLEYTNSRWLFDIIVASINNMFGYAGIYIFVMIISSLIAILYYYIINDITKNKFISFFVTLFIMYISQNVITARSQIVSFLIFLLEYWAIEKLLETKQNRYLIILGILPILLVNLHASVFPMYFVIFLPYIAENILAKLKIEINENIIIENKKINKLLIALLIAVILSFCTPKGVSPYTDMFKAMGGLSTEFITELEPIDINQEIYFWILLFLTTFLLIFTSTKLRITDGLFIIGFALMSLSTYRCVFFFYFISSICIIRLTCNFLKEYEFKVNFNNRIKTLLLTMVYVIVSISSINNLYANMISDYIDTKKYPVNATNYILNNIDVENIRIFNHFNFGSYLELKGIKPFIDSRSGVFTEEFNPGTTILKDWYSVAIGTGHYKDVFEKYQITHALLLNEETTKIYIVDDPEWKIIYQDDSFSLYEKIEK